jgi:hypothetical protein
MYNPHMRYVTVYFPTCEKILRTLPIPGGFSSSPFFYTYTTTPDFPEKKGALLALCENNIGEPIIGINNKKPFLMSARPVTLMFGGWGDASLPQSIDDVETAIKMIFVSDWVVETINILLVNTTPRMELVNIREYPDASNFCLQLTCSDSPVHLESF